MREITILDLIKELEREEKSKVVLDFSDIKKVANILEFDLDLDLNIRVKGTRIELTIPKSEREKIEEKRLNKAIKLINKEGRIWFDSAGVEIEVEKSFHFNTYNIRENQDINYNIHPEELKDILGSYIEFLEIDKKQHPNLSL
jgi:hypothetical protein